MINRTLLKAAAIVSGISGAIILFGSIYPIVSYDRQSGLNRPALLSPVVKNEVNTGLYRADYTKASNWFIGKGAENDPVLSKSNINFYSISVPKLGIEKASVEIAGEDLSKNLIHYQGTTPPGKIGNSVIFGHSILPQFFDPEDYLSIFSTLPKMSKGDEILVEHDGISYQYRVESIFEVLPTDLQVLDQSADSSYLSLVTCVPPGHPLKPRRLVVRAKIVPPNI